MLENAKSCRGKYYFLPQKVIDPRYLRTNSLTSDTMSSLAAAARSSDEVSSDHNEQSGCCGSFVRRSIE